MTESTRTAEAGAPVFCQITGRDISPESCFQTQGQEGCFGCAAATRLCEACKVNFAVVAATGTCSQCTAAEIERESSLTLPAPQKSVTCRLMKRGISGSMCRTMQGQDACRGCSAESRVCEGCESRPVRFPQYGLCFTCSVKEYGEGWEATMPDRARFYPPLHVVRDAAPEVREPGREIVPLAHEFRRIPLANIKDPEGPVRTAEMNEQELFDLGDSMIGDKMIYPVVLELVSENFYEVVIGSRRVRAARFKEQLDIPALILEPQSPLTKLILALTENIHRVQLDPLEEAKVFLRLMKEFGLNTNDISEKVKKPASYVKERIQVLSLPEEVQRLVYEGKLAIDNAAALARVPDERKQVKLARESVKHHYSTAELRKRVNAEVGTEDGVARVIPYEVSPQKFAARTDEFTAWFKRATPQLRLENVTFDDQKLMMGSIASLENQIGKIKQMIKQKQSSRRRKPRNS